MPRNAIGPQNAVTTAPSSDAPTIVTNRAGRIGEPIDRA